MSYENDNIQTIWVGLSDPKPEEEGRGVKKCLLSLRTVTGHVLGAMLSAWCWNHGGGKAKFLAS